MSSSITLSGVSSLNLEEIMIENLSKTNTTNGGILPSSQVANVNESSLNDSVQTIELQGNDTSNTYPIIGKEVNILPSKNSIQTRINASNKIKVNRIVNYEWDQRFNNGQLISVHKSGVYFAYSILTNLTGKVRIFHKKLNEKALLKSFTGRVVDLSFAYYDKEVLLGILDEIGCLQIFKITLENSKMQTSLVLTIAGSRKLAIHTISPIDEEQAHLYSSSESNSSQVILDSTQRIIWCSFIPDSNEVPTSGSASDAHKVFVITRQHQADIFHMNLLEKNYDCSNPLDADKLLKGHLAIREHRSTILSASFSPDGTAITTSSVDGEVNLFKFTFEEEEEENEEPLNEEEEYNFNKVLSLKCLKKWHPHGDKPVNSLYFLDDHKNPQPDAQFWSFLLTGASFNREIKIWSCSNWQCMQTISLKPDPLMTATSRLSMFKSSIDLTSNYLVLSDIARKCFYILHILANLDDNLAYCSAISEFILAFPALSFDIIDSQRIKAKKYNQLNNVNSQQQQGHSDYDLANDLLKTSSLSS
jgi:enhancer of mRNA-decapping protein 4